MVNCHRFLCKEVLRQLQTSGVIGEEEKSAALSFNSITTPFKSRSRSLVKLVFDRKDKLQILKSISVLKSWGVHTPAWC